MWAVEWTDRGLNMWRFARDLVPDDIREWRPEPKTWGIPVAAWASGTCPELKVYEPMKIVLCVLFCVTFGPQLTPRDCLSQRHQGETGSSGPIQAYFMTLICPLQVCGDWAGEQKTWKNSGVDVKDYPTCAHGVRDPTLFKDAYWKINYLACKQRQNLNGRG